MSVNEVKQKTCIEEQLRKYIRKSIKEVLIKNKSLNENNFDSKEEFIEYLEDTLIPDLIDSGLDATANDFKEAIYWMKR